MFTDVSEVHAASIRLMNDIPGYGGSKTSETSINVYETTCRYNPEDGRLQESRSAYNCML